MAMPFTAAAATAVTFTVQGGFGSEQRLCVFILCGDDAISASLYQLLQSC